MAVYNPNIEFFRAQLRSILNQTYPIVRVVIIDDASHSPADITKAIDSLKIEIPEAPEVILTRNNRNQGHTLSFTTYIEKISADVIFFSDQDDIWDHSKIATCMEFFSENPSIKCLTHDFYVCTADLVPQADTIMESIQKNGAPPSTVGHGFATAIKSEVFPLMADASDARGGHDGWIRTFGDTLGIRSLVRKPLAYWRRHPGAYGNSQMRKIENRYLRLKRASYSYRANNYQRCEADFSSMSKWFFQYRNHLSYNESIVIESKLKKISNELKIRNTILNGKILELFSAITRFPSRTIAGDLTARILRTLCRYE